MYRDFFTSKWVLGGFAFLIVFGVACILWYHYDTAPYKRDAAKTEEIAQQWQNAKKASINSQKTDISPQSSSHEEKPRTGTKDSVATEDTNAEEIQSDYMDKTQDIESSETVPVSPHGFGPFPEIPDDYIIKPFSWSYYRNDPPIYELMERVRMKLWKQGIRATGMRQVNGLVYPTIPGTVFVKRYNRDGEDFLEIHGSPKDDIDAIRKALMAGNVPQGINVRDMDEAGIDPYKFLNLSR